MVLPSPSQGASGATRTVPQRFVADKGGNVAILFALAIVPFAGLVGAALDYTRALELRSFTHRETDVAALAVASSDSPNAESMLSALRDRVTNHLGSGSGLVTDVGTSGSWESASVYTLTTKATLATTLARLLPGYPTTMAVSVTTSVKRKPPEWRPSLPTIKDLSYEAADYNRISVYCYDDTKKTEPTKGRRVETVTAIADNGGTDYSSAKLPACEAGETLSYQLRNVRNARTMPSKWDNPAAEHYVYFTDATMDANSRVVNNRVTGGREAANGTITPTDLTSAPIVETIICTTDVDCKPLSQGGILPNNHQTGRTPKTATTPCSEGKSMYYGWEDRPPVSAGASDRDYDDIRIVVSCPSLVQIPGKEVRIIR
jgi:Flp pilus assembly protein TadG